MPRNRQIPPDPHTRVSALPWRNRVTEIALQHQTFLASDPTWSVEKTIKALNLPRRTTYAAIFIYANLDSPLITCATSLLGAYNILKTVNDKSVNITIEEIYSRDWFSEESTEDEQPNIHPCCS